MQSAGVGELLVRDLYLSRDPHMHMNEGKSCALTRDSRSL